jgi:hypothetical protein
MTMLTRKQTEAIQRIVNARPFRNPIVGRAHERYYRIDAATMRILRELAR